jgi:hypothetical protein
MFKKKSKSFIVSSVLVVFALVLAACQPMIASNEAEKRQKAIDAWAANYNAQEEKYLQDQKAIDAWDIHYTKLAENYRKSLANSVDAYVPEVVITRTRLVTDEYMTVYEVKSAGPGWVVFHVDEDGEPGRILRYVYVDGGTSKLVNIESPEELSLETIHVMLHKDKGTIGRFEFPGEDGPVFVGDEIVEEMCLCNY